MPLINLNIPFTQEKLEGKAPKTAFTADDLYKHSGIRYLEKGQWFIHHQTGLNPEKFGYISIKEERLKKHLMTPTEKPPVKWEHKVNPLGTNNQDQVVLLIQDTCKQLRIQQEELFRRFKVIDEQIAALDRLAQKKMNGGNLTITDLSDVRSAQFSSPKLNMDLNTQPVKKVSESVPIQTKTQNKWSSNSTNLPFTLSPISPLSIKTPSGFANPGKYSCYMNASLQVMFNMPPILDAITNYSFHGTVKDIQEEKKARVIACLRDLLLNPGNVGSTEQKSQLNKLLHAFFSYAGGDWKLSELMRQHDAQEFLAKILEMIDFQKMQFEEKIIDHEGERLGPSQLETMISMGIIDQTSFQGCLDNYFTLEDREEPILDNNKKKIGIKKWKKQTLIKNAPDYLFVQLKRFDYDKVRDQSVRLATSIQFPQDEIVDIPTQTDPIKYQIISYINHLGRQPTSGHYTAYVKSAKDNDWYECDDEIAKKADLLSIESQAYIVALKKIIS